MISFFLLGPGVHYALGPNRADARHLAKPIRLGLDDVEDPLAEGLDHLLGVDRPDAPGSFRSRRISQFRRSNLALRS